MREEKVVFNVRSEGIDTAPADFHKMCFQFVSQLCELGTQEMKDRSPSETLKRGGLTWHVDEKGNIIIGTINATALNPDSGFNFAFVLSQGSGLYKKGTGPKSRIFPKEKKVLAWTIPGVPRPTTSQGWRQLIEAEKAYIVPSIKGMKPNPFMEEGLEAAVQKAPDIRDRLVRKFNQRVRS